MDKTLADRVEQTIIEDKYSKHNIRAKIIKDISSIGSKIDKATRLIDRYKSKSYYDSKNQRIKTIDIPSDQIVIEILLLTLVLTCPVKIQAIVGKIANLLKGEPFDRIKTAAELIAVVCHSDLYDIYKDKVLMVKSNYKLEPETIKYIELTKYLPPLVCLPNKLYKNSDDGYLTRSKSVILGKGNYHNEHLALDVLNIASSVSLTLDQNILKYDEPMPDDLDPNDKSIEMKRKIRQFNQFKQVTKDTCNDIGDKPFWFAWKYDKRGRMYSQGYHINIQANEYRKAMISFTKKEVITL